ncbi:acetyl-CoA C-acetyltransferase [Novosphingobium sp. KCTC 2891]|uniref:acetyl-CoA C-acetyltransferase n=1 Tax=Novosphingobium sp. KCTC 2891 TaxID=2989730 RepID=UPI0022233BD2|nr:acetyl-CoA C-acetyltransferase [Novosphingobium sp. KCTC 2891]MCW1383627.1 acetyl-CoA C-acetyltransferase [Novosphingobium sp. KCTC 2891]
MTQAYIVDAVRTPRGIGKAGKGALAHLHPQDLGATVLRAIRDRNALDTARVDDIIWSCSQQRGKQGGDLGRLSALWAGYDVKASGMTLDRFCGGGITSVGLAAGQIMAGFEDVVIAGGTEMMSHHQEADGWEQGTPYAALGRARGNYALYEEHPISAVGVAADAIAAMEGIARADMEALGVESQRRAKAAIDAGHFARGMVPVHNRDGSLALDHDEYPRPETTTETLAALKPAFVAMEQVAAAPDGTTMRQMIERKYPDIRWEPVHHVGTSSGVVDGSAALLLASEAGLKANGWRPRARIVTSVNAGDCPTLILNAPVPAARKALARAGLSVADIDLWEINEAFAVVTEKAIRDLGLDRGRVNVNGGAMALGHPIGATGSILIGTALDELERRGGRYALITMCAFGGMAPAIIIERM